MIAFRRIRKKDNQAMAAIIRDDLDEFKVPHEGTVYSDPTTDDLFALFSIEGSFYLVVEDDGLLLGGCGIYPTAGLPAGYAELSKLYLAKNARGKKLGWQLMEKCIDWAKKEGYNYVYLESLPQLSAAIALYRKLGFVRLTHPLGNSGHYSCNIWMEKKL